MLGTQLPLPSASFPGSDVLRDDVQATDAALGQRAEPVGPLATLLPRESDCYAPTLLQLMHKYSYGVM